MDEVRVVEPCTPRVTRAKALGVASVLEVPLKLFDEVGGGAKAEQSRFPTKGLPFYLVLRCRTKSKGKQKLDND